MLETLCDYKNGSLVDAVYDFIEKIVAEKHQVQLFELLEDDKEDPEVLIYKEKYQDEIDELYDIFESEVLNYLNN